MEIEKRIGLLVRLAYEWGSYKALGQEDNPYCQSAKSRCEELRDEMIRHLSSISSVVERASHAMVGGSVDGEVVPRAVVDAWLRSIGEALA